MDEMNNTQSTQDQTGTEPVVNQAPSAYDQQPLQDPDVGSYRPAEQTGAVYSTQQGQGGVAYSTQQGQAGAAYQSPQGQPGNYGQAPQGQANMYNNPLPPQGQSSAYSTVPAAFPPELRKWNWGAFAFNIWWGIGNKCYLPLLCIIPLFNIVWIFFCGAKGNQWAWETGQYSSIAELQKAQASWNRAGFVYFIVACALLALYIFLFAILGASLFAFLFNSGYGDYYYY